MLQHTMRPSIAHAYELHLQSMCRDRITGSTAHNGIGPMNHKIADFCRPSDPQLLYKTKYTPAA